jgi:predicted transcriptional regulator YdeE/catechol 2,3-dioxygenase-like lactoylglutathione lyase family enzyme
MSGRIIQLDSFRAIGLRWEGTWEQAAAGEIRGMSAEFLRRVGEIPHRVTPDTYVGVSYHRKEGFTYHLCVEVSSVETIPEGMVAIDVPANTYATLRQRPGETVEAAYERMHQYLREHGLRERPGQLSILERYPLTPAPVPNEEVQLEICIPVAQQLTSSLTALLVSDLERSKAFYRDVLGCAVTDWWVVRDGLQGLALKLLPAASPADVRPNPAAKGAEKAYDLYAYVADWQALDALYDEFLAKGATIAWAPVIYADFGPWKEFAIKDPDGYTIAFGGTNGTVAE